MALLNTTCPLCDAPHAKKLSVIYSEGLSNVNTSIQSVGTLNTIGRQKITTNGTVAGIQQTDASRKASPPILPPLVSQGTKNTGLLMVGGLIVLWFLWFILIKFGMGMLMSFGLVMAMVVALIFKVANIDTKPTKEEIDLYEEKNKIQLDAYRKWEHIFACNSCGHRFVPELSI